MAAWRRWAWALVAGASVASGAARAEPYLAVQEGFACSVCHVNPTGAGLRNAFGAIWSQTQWPQQPLATGERPPWTGNVGDFLRLGGNLRYGAEHFQVPGGDTSDEFGFGKTDVYAAVDLVPNHLLLYLDERVAPGAPQTQEAWGLLSWGGRRWYVKAGRLYLPFGLRLADDETFVRARSGLNFTTPDEGVEAGYDGAPYSVQLALSNGAGGASETNDGKSLVSSFAYVQRRWRVGVSGAWNEGGGAERRMGALFAGGMLGPVALLGEADWIEDQGPTRTRRQYAGLAEIDWRVLRGHNLKLGAEYLDPDSDIDHDAQNRFSAVWEATPIQFLQARLGARFYEGIPQNGLQNRREAFLELHLYF